MSRQNQFQTENFVLSEDDLRNAEGSDRHMILIRRLEEKVDNLKKEVADVKNLIINKTQIIEIKLGALNEKSTGEFAEIKNSFLTVLNKLEDLSGNVRAAQNPPVENNNNTIIVAPPEETEVAPTEEVRMKIQAAAPSEETPKIPRVAATSRERATKSSGKRTGEKSEIRKRKLSTNETSSTQNNNGLVVLDEGGDLVIAIKLKNGKYECSVCPKKEETELDVRKHHKHVHVGQYKMSTTRESRGKRCSLGKL
ncbi:unnamed protein product [Caenorhabditis angaria]|uniref:C2H2-type domain-containing protein n=1 Tax=Caenorhabditis angaria TaxID=860376 RepID=A0A9P1MTQ0_9PELO|nr:unnamed protein product [Caenorhabditis angaria]